MTLQQLRQLLPTITIGPDDILHYVVRRADQSGDTSDSTSNTTQHGFYNVVGRFGATQTAEVGFTMLLEGSVDNGATQTAEVGFTLLEGSVDTTQHKGATQRRWVYTRRSIREQHRRRRWVLQCCWKVLWTRRSIREQHRRRRWVYNVVGRFC